MANSSGFIPVPSRQSVHAQPPRTELLKPNELLSTFEVTLRNKDCTRRPTVITTANPMSILHIALIPLILTVAHIQADQIAMAVERQRSFMPEKVQFESSYCLWLGPLHICPTPIPRSSTSLAPPSPPLWWRPLLQAERPHLLPELPGLRFQFQGRSTEDHQNHHCCWLL